MTWRVLVTTKNSRKGAGQKKVLLCAPASVKVEGSIEVGDVTSDWVR
jgi:hypothetical protein